MSAARLLAWIVLVGLLTAVTVEDLRRLRIPNVLTGALLLSGLTSAWMTGEPSLGASLAGAALGSLCFLSVALVYRRLRGTDGLGLGDVKFLTGAGAWVSWQGIGPLIVIAATAALLFVAAQWLAGAPPSRDKPIPFGPFLCLALLAVYASQAMLAEPWR